MNDVISGVALYARLVLYPLLSLALVLSASAETQRRHGRRLRYTLAFMFVVLEVGLAERLLVGTLATLDWLLTPVLLVLLVVQVRQLLEQATVRPEGRGVKREG